MSEVNLRPLLRTIGRVARFYPSGQDRGSWSYSKAFIRRNMSWVFEEGIDLGELFNATPEVLQKYSLSAWGGLTAPRRAEAEIALQLLEADQPVSKQELERLKPARKDHRRRSSRSRRRRRR